MKFRVPSPLCCNFSQWRTHIIMAPIICGLRRRVELLVRLFSCLAGEKNPCTTAAWKLLSFRSLGVWLFGRVSDVLVLSSCFCPSLPHSWYLVHVVLSWRATKSVTCVKLVWSVCFVSDIGSVYTDSSAESTRGYYKGPSCYRTYSDNRLAWIYMYVACWSSIILNRRNGPALLVDTIWRQSDFLSNVYNCSDSS